ncbi:flavin reductase family protein [Motilimonas pumila]|uniref:Flavin reductase n=1 Tax=Motilimonas pumila TaxID=2303987 RepID=A0A418YK70_9GAMM|nr:flavin reductase [Motilimonas pumila]RJG51377.1 flavin reductase [Motilimonas pumila]
MANNGNKTTHFAHQDIKQMETRQRARLINSVSGFKSANMIGTCDNNGQTNLAIVSSVMHLGSDPALLGFIMRPHQVARHTLENILATQYYSINAVTADLVAPAHQTSARFDKAQSEFELEGINEIYLDGFHAPFVAQSPIKIGLKLVEKITINSNQTQLIVGEIELLHVPSQALQTDGYLDLESLQIATVSGLDSYHTSDRICRLSYAKPGAAIVKLGLDGSKLTV